MVITDVLLKENGTGGDFVLKDNDLSPAFSIENLITLSLFGGMSDNTEWWGDEITGSHNEKCVSLFEYSLRTIVLSSGGVQELIRAAKSDLAKLGDNYTITVDGSIEKENRFSLKVTVDNDLEVVYLTDNSTLINIDVNTNLDG